MDILRRRRSSEVDEDDNIDLRGAGASKVHKSRKPPNTAFRQQRLKAWQPVLTPKSVIPILFGLAIIFAPLGIAILNTLMKVEVITVDYSHCDTKATDDFSSIPSKYTSHHLRHASDSPDFKWKVEKQDDAFGDSIPTCSIQFNLPKDLKGPIYLYYKLTNFYQNHRKYVQSYDLEQLKGIAVSEGDLADECKPFRTKKSGGKRKLVYPCGLIANSFFNDTIGNPVLLNAKGGSNNQTYEMDTTDISWSSDVDHKYKKTKYNPDDIVPPPNWYKSYPHGYNDSNLPDLSKMTHFQNWMRTAGLPSFYKLYGKNTTSTMSSGTYQLDIVMNYPVSSFGGTKSVVITTNSIFGGRNMSLGILYLIVAIIGVVLGVAFLIQYLIKPRRIGDHNFLQGNSASTGVTNVRDQL